jgi:hypothetical protein
MVTIKVNNMNKLYIFHIPTGDKTATIYSKIYPPYLQKRYALKPFILGNSISRCDGTKETENHNFVPEVFKQTSIHTINSENECSSDYLIKPFRVQTTTIILASNDDIQEGMESQIEPIEMGSPLRPSPESSNNCTLDSTEEVCQIDSKIEHESRILHNRAKSSQVTINEWWNRDDNFQGWWLQKISKHQGRYIPIATIKKNKNWFEYIFNFTDPESSTYRCRICLKSGSKTSQIPGIAREEGIFFKNRKKNGDKIREHGSSSYHKNAIRSIVDLAKNNLPKIIQDNQAMADARSANDLKITSRVIRTVYFEAIVGMSFKSHRRAVQLKEIHGLDLGVHHHDHMAAQRIVHCIGNHMHNDLIERLKISKSPVTLILDCGSDITNKHYLITYLSFIENNKHTIIFYRNIELGVQEDSEALYEALITQFTRDDIILYMQKHLSALVTDGASG